jgi:hypothetical protein
MYQPWVERMNEAQTAAERSAIIEEAMRLSGRSRDWVYRTLREFGWTSGRKQRRDAGTTTQDEQALKVLGAVLAEGGRKNGKATMKVPLAKSILEQNGLEFRVSDGRVRELLRRYKMDLKSQSKASPAQRMRSLHPNHVHMVDPSLCLVYYAPDGGQRIIRDDEAYKNKPFLEGKEHLKCWRYVLIDHYSGSLCVRYYQSKGENMVNLFDFLLFAWGLKDDPMYAFHGLPKILVLDPGSANISKPMLRALASLRVEALPHLPGNPRAKGSVEGGNNLVELGLESRLKFEPVNSVAELNDLANRWCAAYNSNQIEGLDCQITRMGRKMGSRLSLWQHITQDQLVELPDEEICRLLLSYEPVTRIVDGQLSFSYDHPKSGRRYYSMYGQPGVTVGTELQVQPILTEAQPIMVATWRNGLEDISVEVGPIEQDEAGFAQSGAVFGQEYKRPKDTGTETSRKELTRLAHGTLEPKRGAVPFAAANDGQGLKAHSFLDTEGWAGQDIKPAVRVGTPVEVTAADVVRPEEVVCSATEAVKRIKPKLFPNELPAGYLADLKARYPNGVPTSHIDDLAHEIVAGTKHTKLFKEA